MCTSLAGLSIGTATTVLQKASVRFKYVSQPRNADSFTHPLALCVLAVLSA